MKNSGRSKFSVVVVGGGVMGSILLGILTKSRLTSKITVCERDSVKRARLKRLFPKISVSDNFSAVTEADMVVFAVKPQDFRETTLKIKKNTLLISIMAGVSIAALRGRTGATRIIRAMPNTSAQLGLGFTAWTATSAVGQNERQFAKTIFAAMGTELYVRTEDLINKFTAVSGSGPAYFFYSALSLYKAAVSLGISSADANHATIKTLEGAAAILSSGGDIEGKISQVASKGGTTEAALSSFKKSKFEDAWTRAVRVAYNRAKELEKKSE